MIILTPAYGRDYKSKAAVLADFDANKDFIFNDLGNRYDGKPVNKSQLREVGQKSVQFRYGDNRKTFVSDI